MNILSINKNLIFAAILIVAGITGFVDSASANYVYKHNPLHDYKFDSHHNRSGHSYQHRKYYKHHRKQYGHGYKTYGYKNHGYKNYGHKKYYKKRYKRHYSPSHKSYSNGYVRNHSYGYYDDRSYKYHDRGYERRYHKKHIAPHCYSYKVTTHGGRGGFRFQHNKKDFKRVNHGSYVNKICGYNSVEFELSKVDPGVSVSIEINGQFFHYPAHSGQDRYVNHWYRKYFSVNLGRY